MKIDHFPKNINLLQNVKWISFLQILFSPSSSGLTARYVTPPVIPDLFIQIVLVVVSVSLLFHLEMVFFPLSLLPSVAIVERVTISRQKQ